MIHQSTDRYQEIRDAVRQLCAEFPDEYHRRVDHERAYPVAFVDALTKAGWLAAMIPAEYGGSGLGLAEASVVMEEINRSGGNSGVCHGQMYNMGTLLRHGSEAQKQFYLPKIASGEWRLQSMGVTEPSTGTDTTKIKTTATKSASGDRYVDDPEQLRREARRARALGFGGKLCIHPKQVATVNQAFAPTAQELAWAQRVLAASAEAEGSAVQLNGQMIDRPVLLQAQSIVNEMEQREEQ